MKKLIILFCLFPFLVHAQGIFIKPNNSFGTINNRVTALNTLYTPTGCGAPVGNAGLQSSPGQLLKQAAIYADTCGHHIYWYHPNDSSWSRIDTGGGSGSGTVTAVVISHDSLYYTTGSGNTFVGLLVTQPDSTIKYVTPTQLITALGNKVANQAGVSFLGYGTYAGKPTSGTGIWYATDSSSFFYINGATATNMSGSYTFYIQRSSPRGDTLLHGYSNLLRTPGIVDSGDFKHFIDVDSTWALFVQAHDTTSANALQPKYRTDTMRANIYAAINGAGSFITSTSSPAHVAAGNLTIDTTASDIGHLPDINATTYAIGLSASSNVTNYPATGIRGGPITPYKLSSTAYGGGTYYGGWLTSHLTGDSVLIYLPVYGVVFGDSQAEGNPGRYGRLTTYGTGVYTYNYPDSDGQVSYELRVLTGYRWYNHGIGNNTTIQMMARFGRDVLGQIVPALNPSRTLSGPPKVVVIIAGINDIGNGIASSVTKTNLMEMVSQASAAGIYVVVCTLPGQTAFSDFQSQQIDSLNTWMKSGVFNGLNCTVFDYGNLVWRADPIHGDNITPSTLIGPPIHPTLVGYDSLAARLFRYAHVPVLKSFIVTNETQPAFTGYSRPTGFTVQSTAYTSSHSTDTIPVTVPLTLDSVWVKITASTNISGTSYTGFSGIGAIMSNVVGKGSYTKITTPTTNQNAANSFLYPQTFNWSTQTPSAGGLGVGLAVGSGTITQSNNGDSLIQFDFRKTQFLNPSGFAITRNFSMGLSGDLLLSGIRIGLGQNGANNSFAGGLGALNNTTSAGNNIALGGGALQNDTSGSFNIGIGPGALLSLSNGHDNTVIGYHAGNAVTTGINNTLIGSGTGLSLTSGQYNFYGGVSAGAGTTSGQFNTAAGYSTLSVIGSHQQSSAFGVDACQSCAADNESAFGAFALQHTSSGGLNSAFGVAALSNNTTGANNAAFGVNAGLGNTTGSFNVPIGPYVDVPSATASGQLNIDNLIFGLNGMQSTTNSSSPTSTGLVGIGTNAPTAILHLGGSRTSAASFRVAGGVAPTSPNDGDIWNDSTTHHLMTRLNGTTYQLDQQSTASSPVIYSQTTAGTAIASSSAGSIYSGATSTGSLTIPANTLQVGQTITLHGYARVSTAASPGSITFNPIIGGTGWAGGPTPAGGLSGSGFEYEVTWKVVSIGSSGTVMGTMKILQNAANPYVAVNSGTLTINTTGSLTLDIQFTWTTYASGDSFTSSIGEVKIQ